MSGEAVTEAPSTHDIVADVVNTAEASAEESSATDTAASEETAAAPTPPAAEPPRELSIEEQLLHEFGFKDLRRPDGREHYISRSKVLQMIGSGLKRGQARWDGERTSLEARAKELTSWQEEIAKSIQSEDTDAVLAEFAKYNPRFQRYLQQQQAKAEAAPAVDDKPKPDLDLGDGRWTYSVEQNEKLVEWKARQMMDERFKPFEEREKAEKARAEQAQAQEQMRGRVSTQLEEAKAWPNWTDHEPAILKLLQDDSAKSAAAGKRPSMTLREAYLEAQTQYLAADDTAKRQRWLEEANKAPRSTSVARTGVESTRPATRTTKDIVRETVARLEKSS